MNSVHKSNYGFHRRAYKGAFLLKNENPNKSIVKQETHSQGHPGPPRKSPRVMGAHPDLMKVPLCRISAERNSAALQSYKGRWISSIVRFLRRWKGAMVFEDPTGDKKQDQQGKEKRSSVWEERGGADKKGR